MNGFSFLPSGFWPAVAAATIFDLLLYTFLALTTKRTEARGRRWNPLVITAGVHGRASLANLQVLYFSLIVFWVVVFDVLRAGELPQLSADVWLLLGIGGAGTIGAKIVAGQQSRLTSGNESWLRRKNWIKRDIGPPRRPPQWADLVTGEGAFDAFRFQNLGASLIVGIAFLLSALDPAAAAETGGFQIPDAFLALLGLSQAGYVGGKAVSPAPVAELDRQLTRVRELDARLKQACAAQWQSSGAPAEFSAAAARAAAAPEYEAYMAEANVAAKMVEQRTGNSVTQDQIEPDMA